MKQTIFQKGVQQLTSRTITSSEIPSRLAVNLPANVANIGDIMGLGLQFGLLANQYITELDFRLQIGEAQGQARTVARPNIQVSDGKNAVIKSGSVLNVQTSSPQWGTNAELVEVCLKLQVTPKILSDGRIKMTIVVTDNEPNIMPTTGELYLEREAHTTYDCPRWRDMRYWWNNTGHGNEQAGGLAWVHEPSNRRHAIQQ